MWMKTADVNGNQCYVDFAEQIVVYILQSALKHQTEDEVLEMFCGNIQRRVVKPSMDIDAGSALDIVHYRGICAELGRVFVSYADNDIPNIPPYFEVFDVFHAFCATIGYYHYADYIVDSPTGITDSWYDIMDFYQDGGYIDE